MSPDTLVARLAALPPLEPPDRLARRVQDSLLAGANAPALVGEPPRPGRQRRWQVLVAATAAVAIGLLWPRPDPLPLEDDFGWLVPRTAFAQATPPGLRRLAALVPGRMRAGTWVYRSRTHGPDGFEVDRGETRLTVAAGMRHGDSVWVMVRQGRGRPGTGVIRDSITVRRATLAPVARVRVPWGGSMLFRGDSVVVEVPRHGLRYEWALPAIAEAPYLADLATLLPAVPFTREFHAGVPVLVGFRPQGPVHPLEMTVAGEEAVTVPAGTFTCYRVQLGGRSGGDVWWVDMASGRLVKSANQWGGDMEDETVLLEVR